MASNIHQRIEGSDSMDFWALELWIGENEWIRRTGEPSAVVKLNRSFGAKEWTVTVKGPSWEHSPAVGVDFLEILTEAVRLANLPIEQLLVYCRRLQAELAERRHQITEQAEA